MKLDMLVLLSYILRSALMDTGKEKFLKWLCSLCIIFLTELIFMVENMS